ncbi:MAG: trypsin-like peptidase domain-containing protein [Candidatus Zixiibacteriota bacterium]
MNKTRNYVLILAGLVFLSANIFAQTKKVSPTLIDLSNSFNALSDQVSPAVVNILATGWSSPSNGGSTALLSKSQSTGSGVILDVNGYIVTNAHVVEDAHLIEVVLNSTAEQAQFKSILKPKGEKVEATLVGLDIETDLAVLKIPLTGLSHLELANSDDLKQGQLVFAFGSPMGLQNSVTMGVVSAVARQLMPEAPMIYIQTDASINPGNSGGPLVNTDGKVVGINTFILTQSGGSEGLGFAAPSNIVKTVFEQIKEYGRVRRGEIGAYAQTINRNIASGLKLSKDWGVVLGDVFPESPAEKAGLKIGDIVNALNGKTMENGRQFNVNLYRKSVGDTVVLEIMRGDKLMTVKTEVIERKDDYERFADLVTPDENLIQPLRILGLDLSPTIIEMLPKLRSESGVLVADRIASYSFTDDDFKPGDIIHSLNQAPIAGLAGLRRTLQNYAHDEPVVIQIERRGKFMYLVVQLQ